jgi:hypothetical protein
MFEVFMAVLIVACVIVYSANAIIIYGPSRKWPSLEEQQEDAQLRRLVAMGKRVPRASRQ